MPAINELPINVNAAIRMIDGAPSIGRRRQYDDRRAPLLPQRGQRKSRLLPTPWPKVGGVELGLALTDKFLSERWRDQFEEGEARLIYAAGCPGLATVSKSVHMPNYKVSSCAEVGLARRMFELNRDEVGALRFLNGNYVRDQGWNRWFPSHLYPIRGASPNSPVLVRPRCLIVRLPITMPGAAFDDEFDSEVRKGALDVWAMTAEARVHCAAVGVNPDHLLRFTRYPDWSVMPVQEIAGLSIYSGADRLIRIAENILLAHYGLSSSEE